MFICSHFTIYLFSGPELTKFQSGFRIPATRTPSWLWVKVISSNIFAGLFSKINFQNLLCGNFLIIYFLNFLGIKNRLQLNDPRDRMNFEVHADTMSKTSSGIKAKYTLWRKKNLPQPLPSHTVSFDVNFCPVLSEVLTWSFRYEKLLIC